MNYRSNSEARLDREDYVEEDIENEIPPHCHITIRCTREIAGFNGLGEAVKRLDFRSSVRDRRRFQYVCSLLRLLVSNKGIANLPGSAQRMLLQMLEEVASHGMPSYMNFHSTKSSILIHFFLSIPLTVSDSQQNINILRGLAIQLQKIVNQENQKCWGKPLGSEILWKGHVETIQRIQQMATQIKINEVCTQFSFKSYINVLVFRCIVSMNYFFVYSLVQRFIQNYKIYQKNVFVRLYYV